MNIPLILPHFLDRAVTLYGDKKAVYCEERSFTYRELNERVNKLSHGLRDLGVTKGDRVAYLASNTVEMLEGFYGVFQLGAITVPMNIRLISEDYLYILNHSGSTVLMVDQDYYHLIEPIKDQLKTIQHIIVQYKDASTNEVDYDVWLGKYASTSFERAEIAEDDICNILYTSGTTGRPKGVMLSHRNNYLHALSSMHHIGVRDSDVYLHVLPMFHVNGWGSPFYYTANGATHICLRRVTPEAIYQALQTHKVSIMHMAPTVLNALLQYNEENKPVIKHDIRILVAGSAPPPAFVARVEKELGWRFIQVYGMTETAPLTLFSTIRSGVTSHLSEEEQMKLKARTGYQMIGTDVRVVNDNGEEVVPDGKEVGELVVRGHGVMKGYWNNEEETSKVIQDGWFHTGDMGTIDEFEYIDIIDRKKDVIISGGENISSIEVEGILYEHPAVLEAAIIAVPHEKWGETPHAYIVKRKNETVNEQEIISFTREKLAHFKSVKSVTFVDELPKSASGKIQKIQLRDEYLTSN